MKLGLSGGAPAAHFLSHVTGDARGGVDRTLRVHPSGVTRGGQKTGSSMGRQQDLDKQNNDDNGWLPFSFTFLNILHQNVHVMVSDNVDLAAIENGCSVE